MTGPESPKPKVGDVTDIRYARGSILVGQLRMLEGGRAALEVPGELPREFDTPEQARTALNALPNPRPPKEE